MHKPMSAFLTALCTLQVATACHRAESPVRIDPDMAAARESAARIKLAVAADEPSEPSQAAPVSAQETQKVVDTEAEGARKVALAACEGLNDATQKNCRDQVEAAYPIAKALTEPQRAATEPNP